ncbi:hypothetical protein PV326_013063, partial [Microctonus aethiopoides]
TSRISEVREASRMGDARMDHRAASPGYIKACSAAEGQLSGSQPASTTIQPSDDQLQPARLFLKERYRMESDAAEVAEGVDVAEDAVDAEAVDEIRSSVNNVKECKERV